MYFATSFRDDSGVDAIPSQATLCGECWLQRGAVQKGILYSVDQPVQGLVQLCALSRREK